MVARVGDGPRIMRRRNVGGRRGRRGFEREHDGLERRRRRIRHRFDGSERLRLHDGVRTGIRLLQRRLRQYEKRHSQLRRLRHQVRRPCPVLQWNVRDRALHEHRMLEPGPLLRRSMLHCGSALL